MPPEFSIRANSVDVEQIMKQIRARIREKRGVDYTEEEIRELANIKLEKFLDPSRVRSELLAHYRKGRPSPSAAPIVVPPAPANYTFEADTAYLSSRGALGQTLYALRRLLNPLLKLFINPTPMIHVLHMQSTINQEQATRFDRFLEQWQERESRRTELDALGYEVAHNLVVEMTRLGIEVKNLKMRVESLASRLDFSERRARALESVVQYRSGAAPAAQEPSRQRPGGDERRRAEHRRAEHRRDERRSDDRKGDDRKGGERRGDDRKGDEHRRDERRGDDHTGERRPEGEEAAGIVKGEAQRSRRKRRRRGRGSGQSQPAPEASQLRPDDATGSPGTAESFPEEGGSPERDAGGTSPAGNRPSAPETVQGGGEPVEERTPGPVRSDVPAWPEDPDSPVSDES